MYKKGWENKILLMPGLPLLFFGDCLADFQLCSYIVIIAEQKRKMEILKITPVFIGIILTTIAVLILGYIIIVTVFSKKTRS